MEAEVAICYFDLISDDILLHILSIVPRHDWKHICKVCTRFRNVCHDKDIFKVADLSCAYGWSEQQLADFIRAGSSHIESLILNHCYWLSATFFSTFVSRCKKIRHLYLLDCKLTTKGLSKIVCSVECLESLAISVSNMLEFSNMINGNQEVQSALKNLKHFGLHIREESNGNVPNSLQFHLSQQTTVIEYCPYLESFCVIGTPGLKTLSKRLIHPLVVKTAHMKNLKTMSINCTNDATSRLYFFGILVKAFDEPGIVFKNLSVSGLDLKQAVKRSFFIRSLQESCPTLVNLDFSKVHLDELEAAVTIEKAPSLKYLNLSEIRSDSPCLRLLSMASRCTNLVSLNLKGVTSGCRNWGEEELDGLDQVLGSCRQLKHLNLAGIHVHEKGSSQTASKSLTDVLIKHDISAFESLAVPVCCLVGKKETALVSSSKGIVFTQRGKRRRIAASSQPSTSSQSADTESVQTELSRLSSACPDITSLELINTGFKSSVIYSSQLSSLYDPCELSHRFRDAQLCCISRWKNLKYLQLTGLPGVSSCSSFREIATQCVQIERLYLAYISLGSQVQPIMETLQYFKNLKDLRIEQPWLKLDERFYESCLGCEQLQRLVVICKNSKPDVTLLNNYIQKASRLYVIQLFSDMTLKDCDRYQSILQKRYEGARPGFQAVLEQVHHERVPFVLAAMPLVHLDEITSLSSKICSKPLYSSCGE